MSLNSPSGDAAGFPQEPIALGYWVRLTNQMDRLQSSMEQLLEQAGIDGSQTDALLRHLTDPDRDRALEERIAGLVDAQDASQEQLQSLASGLSDLSQTVAKLNRVQFKTNTLAELKDQQVDTALATLQDIAAGREQARDERVSQEQDRVSASRMEARGEFAADLLPALDGVEMAADSARALLLRLRDQAKEGARKAQAQKESPEPVVAPNLWQRLRWALSGRGLPPGSLAPSSTADNAPGINVEIAEALAAWLQGLEMVRSRFLALLATVDIYPIEAEGRPFDPHLHLAMTAESRSERTDGIVLAVLRKGYVQRSRVLRYAEVTVNHLVDGGNGTGPFDGDFSSGQQETHLTHDDQSTMEQYESD